MPDCYRVFAGLLGVALLVAGGTSTARAEVIARDSFDYRANTPAAGNGDDDSFGFADAWSDGDSFNIASGSLEAPRGHLPSQGNRVSAASHGGNRNLRRTLAEPLGQDDTTIYISFLMRAEGTVGEGYYHGWFGFALRSDRRDYRVYKVDRSERYGLGGSVGQEKLSRVPVVSGETHLFVLRADFREGADEYRLYIDPAPGGPEPDEPDVLTTDADLGEVLDISLSGSGAFSFDELLIGETWSDVTSAEVFDLPEAEATEDEETTLVDDDPRSPEFDAPSVPGREPSSPRRSGGNVSSRAVNTVVTQVKAAIDSNQVEALRPLLADDFRVVADNQEFTSFDALQSYLGEILPSGEHKTVLRPQSMGFDGPTCIIRGKVEFMFITDDGKMGLELMTCTAVLEEVKGVVKITTLHCSRDPYYLTSAAGSSPSKMVPVMISATLVWLVLGFLTTYLAAHFRRHPAK